MTHTVDDSTKHVLTIIDTMDKYGIKATLFISTEQDLPVEERFFTQLQVWNLWPRLERAIDDGHEIGSHARTHPCRRPDTEEYWSAAYTEDEVVGSRDDILRRTKQPHVWSWCYPCGHCANHEFIRKRITDAGYIVARSYPDEPTNGHLVPDLRTWAPDFFNAAYSQVVQKRGGSATTQIIDVDVLNRKFDTHRNQGKAPGHGVPRREQSTMMRSVAGVPARGCSRVISRGSRLPSGCKGLKCARDADGVAVRQSLDANRFPAPTWIFPAQAEILNQITFLTTKP